MNQVEMGQLYGVILCILLAIGGIMISVSSVADASALKGGIEDRAIKNGCDVGYTNAISREERYDQAFSRTSYDPICSGFENELYNMYVFMNASFLGLLIAILSVLGLILISSIGIMLEKRK